MKQDTYARTLRWKIIAADSTPVIERFMEPTFRILVAGLVDRIQNLLAPIKANAQFLLSDAITPLEGRDIPGVDVAELKDAVSDTLKGIRKLEELAQAFTQFEEAISQLVRRGTVTVSQLIHDSLEPVRGLAAESGIEIQVSAAVSEIGNISIYSRMVQRALTHLVRNAIEGVNNTRPQKIVISVERSAEDVVFHVRDDGPGFPAKMRTSGFIPFETEGKGYDRHGLGLAYATAVAKMHGGNLEVESKSGGGTRASLIVPTGAKTATITVQHPPYHSRPRVTAPVHTSVRSGSSGNVKLAEWIFEPAGEVLAGALMHYINNAMSYAGTNVEYVCGQIGKLPAGTLDANVIENVERINREVHEAVSTLRRILTDFESILCSIKKEEPETTLLRAEVDESIGRILETVSDGVVDVHVEDRREAPGEMTVMLEPLREILDAVVANAVQAASAASTRGRVQVELNQVGGETIIRVANDGASIAQSIHPRVFYPFVTLGKPGASGMGLTRALLAAHLLGATIEVASEPGGVQVDIRIPD